MSEFPTPEKEYDPLLGLDKFLHRRLCLLMEKIANLPEQKSPTPFGYISFDKNKKRIYPNSDTPETVDDAMYAEIFKETKILSQDYFDAAKQSLEVNNVLKARFFIDQAMQLLANLNMEVPEEFVVLNAEILSKTSGK
jgi:hypothetical protein